jgi:hydrogenase maturation protease
MLVLGIGNPLMGDDGLGVEVVRRLREKRLPPPVELLDGGTAGVYLLPHLEGRTHILVVDAIDFGGQPGQVVRLHPSDIPARVGIKLSEHQVTFHEILALMDLMGFRPREFICIGAQPRSNNWGDPLSPEVEAAIPHLMEEIEKQLASWMSALLAERRAPA